MNNLTITPKQELELISNGYTSLPQIKIESISSDEIDYLISSRDKTYTASTEFHKKYIEKNKIYLELKNDLKEIAKKYYKNKAKYDDTYSITRITKGSQSSESYLGHFDSHLFTLVTPVVIPEANTEEFGQLIIFPKIRKEPKNELINIFWKTFYKIYNTKEKFTKLMEKKNYVELDFKDSNPILFLGRVSLHANRGFKEDMKTYRITLLTHFFDPSPKYGIGNMLRIFRSR
jgi:hypothetical protein